MEAVQKFIRGVAKDVKFTHSGSGSGSGSSSETPHLGGEGRAVGVAAALSGPATAGLLVTRHPRNSVSLSTCSKLCGFFFVAGIVVGYTLNTRLRRWASKLLKKIRD